ncbi:MAG: ATP-binding protein [Chromatiaceae bacterium]|jgi:PAS domain S-box-containing protein|nr:ATP-binding protein [Chromatiaceae bacterium]
MGRGSLSVRLSAVLVAVLVAAALGVGYVFERGRTEAIQSHAFAHLRLHGVRAADEVERFINQVRRDALVLADTPPIQGVRRALEGGGVDAVGGSTLAQWEDRLGLIFAAFSETRPEYFELRLTLVADGGRDLVRFERGEGGPRIVAGDAMGPGSDAESCQEMDGQFLQPGEVWLSRIHLHRRRGEVRVPHRPVLHAAAAVRGAAGESFAQVVVSLDMARVFERAASFRDASESLYIANERGDFLLHPEPGRALAFEVGAPLRIADAFPQHAELISGMPPDGGAFFELNSSEGETLAYVTARTLDPDDPSRRFILVITEPTASLLHAAGVAQQRQSLLAMGVLLSLAALLVVLTVQRLTRSLRALASASALIAEGRYAAALPAAEGEEVGSLVRAFRHMVREIERREDALGELNRDLEQRVAERSEELARQHELQDLILDSIADGVVVADGEGRFLLWNRKAQQITGCAPEAIAPESWSERFGVFRDEGGEAVPVAELPLVRAMRGEAADNVELYLRHPAAAQGRWVQITARPFPGRDGRPAGGVAVLVDVTEQRALRRRLEAHRRELAEVGRLALGAGIASSAAHQLSQPLGAISSYAGALVRLHQQGRLTTEQLGDLLTRIEGLASQAGEVLDRLRGLIRRRTRAEAEVDINQVTESCLDFFRDRIEQRGVRVERRYGSELPRPIGDPIELGQMLIQLIENALEAMSETAPGERCLIVATRYDAGADTLVIEVADSGPGVSPERAAHLFEPWQTSKADALGIGLYIAKTIIETHNGRISMGVAETGGALFRIELPAEANA